MSARYENIRQQTEVAEQTRGDLGRALDDLATTAKAASKFRVPIEDVYGAVSKVRRAEEAHDLALLDVATARGEDA